MNLPAATTALAAGLVPALRALTTPGQARRLTALLLCLLLTPPALAGSETYGDVTVNLDPPPGDSSNYGYAVYRLTVTNRGPAARTVTVTLPASTYSSGGDSIRRLTRTLRVGPNSTAAADLTQPAIALDGSDARVGIDGSPQRDLLPVDLVDHDAYGEGDLLLVGRGVPDGVRNALDAGLTEWQQRLDDAGGSGFYGSGRDPAPTLVRADRPAPEWSDNWLFYTRYLGVMLTADEARQLTPPASAALRDYVAAGGIVTLIGDGGTKPGLPADWQAGWNRTLAEGRASTDLAYGLGQVTLTDADRLADLPGAAWESMLDGWRTASADRRVVTPAADAESRLSLIENVQVPVRGLLALMLVFTLVIGPVNLLVLNRLNRRMWLLWTIPVIAFAFSAAVLLYSLLSEGISPRAKTVAVTLLDQTTRRAVTVGATGYYAPLTPGGGLRFDTATSVAPQYGDDSYGYGYSRSGRPRTLDLTNGQHLASGWVVARVPAHFILRKPGTMRERLDISRDPESGGLRVVNGLGKLIESLRLTDGEGNLYLATALAPGASAVAKPEPLAATGDDPMPSQEVIERMGVWMMASQLAIEPPRFRLAPSTYLAVLNNTSFLEPGLAGLTDHDTTGVVVGYWGEAE